MNTVAGEFASQTDLARRACHAAENLRAAERERLILDHLPQVRLIVRKIRARLPAHVSFDDLMSTGTLGLISAIDRFDGSRNIQLKTYAEHKIRGAILDSLRRLDWAPRQQRRRAKQIEAAVAVAEQRLLRKPAQEEIAAELNLTLDAYHHWQLETGGVAPGRLESAGSDSFAGSRSAPRRFRRREEVALRGVRAKRTAARLGGGHFWTPGHREDRLKPVLPR